VAWRPEQARIGSPLATSVIMAGGDIKKIGRYGFLPDMEMKATTPIPSSRMITASGISESISLNNQDKHVVIND
jgi:hypothetical protein